jgi:hypothetical protein
MSLDKFADMLNQMQPNNMMAMTRTISPGASPKVQQYLMLAAQAEKAENPAIEQQLRDMMATMTPEEQMELIANLPKEQIHTTDPYTQARIDSLPGGTIAESMQIAVEKSKTEDQDAKRTWSIRGVINKIFDRLGVGDYVPSFLQEPSAQEKQAFFRDFEEMIKQAITSSTFFEVPMPVKRKSDLNYFKMKTNDASTNSRLETNDACKYTALEKNDKPVI